VSRESSVAAVHHANRALHLGLGTLIGLTSFRICFQG